LESWMQLEVMLMDQKLDKNRQAEELDHLEKEFKLLKERYDNLERKVSRNEEILASIPQLARQFLFLALKHQTSTQPHVSNTTEWQKNDR
jgi:hypothetical protein